KLLLEFGASLRSRKSTGMSLFHRAAIVGNPDVIDEMIDYVEDIDELTKDGKTALMLAVENKRLQAVDLLLQGGANPCLEDVFGKTSLDRAVLAADVNIVNAISEYMTDIGGGTRAFSAALRLAAANASMDIVQLLLSFGAMPALIDRKGLQAFHYAAMGGDPRIIKILHGGEVEVDVPTSDGQTALMIAASHGKIDATQLLLNFGANIEATDERGWTALHHAASRSEAEAVDLLLQKGADPHALTANGSSALSIAVGNQCEPLIALLAREGCDLDRRDEEGRTQLLLAASNRQWTAVKSLVKAGADVHLADSARRTPLWLARRRGAPEEVLTLLQSPGSLTGLFD
ncbi:MAG TPA: ankyrin repeat domain-containing protein, partial [Burkholderiaceae bacterium]|nr:ankyrin repeat domain-containing protein [Burkholderiaceae bacterium]